MPELPDVVVYIEALQARVAGARFERARLATPFLLRSVDPPLAAASGRRVTALRRLGKRIVIGLEDEEGDAASARLLITRAQAAAFVKQANELMKASRQICQWCNQPKDPGGHICARSNGHVVH